MDEIRGELCRCDRLKIPYNGSGRRGEEGELLTERVSPTPVGRGRVARANAICLQQRFAIASSPPSDRFLESALNLLGIINQLRGSEQVRLFHFS